MDDAIAQMVSLTNTTPECAQQYLQVADGDLQQAISLFFENGGADLGGSSTNTATQSGRQVAGAGDSQNPIPLDDDENISDDNDPAITGYHKPTAQPSAVEDDETMARRLQEEMYGAANEENTVRAPIARQAEVLVGPGSSDYYGGRPLDQSIEERLMQMNNRRGRYCTLSNIELANKFRPKSTRHFQPAAHLTYLAGGRYKPRSSR